MSEAVPAVQVNKLSAELRDASDAKLLKVTQMIDLLPDRGEADLLLASVRTRLATLHPARPMTATRLLFMPLEPVLVPASAWRQDQLTIPRSLVRPLTGLVLDEASRRMQPLPQGACDDAAIERAGDPLWRMAAERLAVIELPPHWSTPAWQQQNGLTVPLVVNMIPAIRLILANAVALRSLPPSTSANYPAAIGTLLSEAAATGALGWGIMLAVLLDGDSPDQVARLAAGVARGSRHATILQQGLNQATSQTLDRIETQIRAPVADDPADAATLTLRLALTARIEGFRRFDHRPAEEQRRVTQLRQAVAATNRSVFERTLLSRLPGAGALAAAGPAALIGSAAVHALEAAARQLRNFALGAARLGEGGYDGLLEQAVTRYVGPGSDAGLTTADRLRLVELLIGTEKAMQMLVSDRSTSG